MFFGQVRLPFETRRYVLLIIVNDIFIVNDMYNYKRFYLRILNLRTVGGEWGDFLPLGLDSESSRDPLKKNKKSRFCWVL